MAQKRSRATFESDATSVLYGTPLPPLDPDVRDDGSYVPIWKQDATDERGRKRFHGAFTGGFSAGYFNTVGTKDGWTPATFVSSRANRAKDNKEHTQQRPEDFMDEEDLAEQAEAQKLTTADAFTGLGSTAVDSRRKNGLLDLMQPSSSIGVKLLQKMGWKEGQGIGPRIRRKARLEDGDDSALDAHWFAPENTKMINFFQKTDTKGLGFAGEATLSSTTQNNGSTNNGEDDDDSSILARSKSKFGQTSKSKKSSFGVGVLNDTGSDDEDPYTMGPKISYNRSIGAVKKSKKPNTSKAGGLVTSSNPLLTTKPIFISKKKLTSNLRKCHDGRLPLDGFILSSAPIIISTSTTYAPPKVPDGWKSSKTPLSASTTPPPSTSQTYQSSADAARTSTHDPKTRASLLGETLLPGKSVFAYLTPAARERLVSASSNPLLPAAGNEPVPEAFRKSDADRAKSLWARVPVLDAAVARAALARVDFMPYADDLPKRARYRAFLAHAAAATAAVDEENDQQRRDELPERAVGFSVDEWVTEMREFAQAAAVFRPVSGLMASRFTSSSSSGAPTFEGGGTGGEGEAGDLLRRPPAKPEDPAEQAARMGMFGIMTRSVKGFAPTRLLCKRFGVKPPAEVDLGEGDDEVGIVEQPVSKEDLERMRMETIGRGTSLVARDYDTYGEKLQSTGQLHGQKNLEQVVDAEKNDALEGERPGDAVFKAIFGSDDEDDD
jgi:G patch domain-containing protein 1